MIDHPPCPAVSARGHACQGRRGHLSEHYCSYPGGMERWYTAGQVVPVPDQFCSGLPTPGDDPNLRRAQQIREQIAESLAKLVAGRVEAILRATPGLDISAAEAINRLHASNTQLSEENAQLRAALAAMKEQAHDD